MTDEQLPRIFVGTCSMRVSSTPVILHAVLGSCVSVCLFDPASSAGGMNHYLLGESPTAEGAMAMADVGKYADRAIPGLLRSVLRIGARRESVVAKIVGGARILKLTPYATLAEENVEAGRRQLRSLGIPVVAEDCGGTRGRKIEFHTGTGRLVVNADKVL